MTLATNTMTHDVFTRYSSHRTNAYTLFAGVTLLVLLNWGLFPGVIVGAIVVSQIEW
jgi:hypothetical protein